MYRKKILFVIPSLSGGGAEKVITHLVNHLDRSKFASTLVLLQKKGEYLSTVKNDINIIDLKAKRVRYSLFKICRVIKDEKPDIVLSTLGHLNVFISIFLPFFPKSPVYIARESNIVSLQLKGKNFMKLLYKLFYNNFDKIIAQSEDMKEDLGNNFNINPNKIIKIHNPIDFDCINEKLKEKRRVNLPKNKINLLSVGRLSYQKGFDLLLNAFSQVERDDIHLTILGQGELEEELKQQAKDLNIETKVSFLGFQENPYLYMEKADILVLSSRYEGFPNVVLEAMACGTPILANNCKGGINELIQKGINGYITDFTKFSTLKEIDNIILQNFNANKIKRIVLDNYSMIRIIEQYENMFISINK